MAQDNQANLDVLLVGAGIMSATLATMLKELDSSLRLEIVEQMEDGAMESSNPWNNAGTGHAGLCELNYTPQAADGSIDIAKAININAMFEESKQFWSHLVDTGTFGDPETFIHPVPHMSFVQGKDSIAFLQKRAERLNTHHAFESMEFTTDKSRIAQWLPLMMAERNNDDEEIAATHMSNGTDVNFGALTLELLSYLDQQDNNTLSYKSKVVGLERCPQGWKVSIKNLVTGQHRTVTSRFVFLGAGGAALPMLQKSGIPEGKGYGGFPVSGQWLRCDNPAVVEQHQAKVYSLAAVGSPPMSVPHLDTRIVDGKKSLLFGPFAGFTTKFLKHGSFLDLPLSVRFSNILPMLAVSRDNMDLTRYLVSEVMQSMEQRLDSLRRFYPQLDPADWKLEIAGQRVQIIKKDEKTGGKLQFGTELVTSADGSMAALLGASPGASVTVSIMLDLIKRCFPEQQKSAEWTEKLAAIFPAPLKELETNAELYRSTQERSDKLLKLR